MTHADQQSDTRGHNVHSTLLEHTPDTLAALFASWDEPGFRAKQVLEWVYRRDVDDYERMTNLSKSLRTRLTGVAGADQTCFNCTFYKEEAGQPGLGGCALFANKLVEGKGWCISWVPIPA